jgi:hypothetical protein
MYKGLFINNRKAKDSIYESGYMVYKCLLLFDKCVLDYIEVDNINREIPLGYDFYFFNYHPVTMGWLETKDLKKELGFTITIVLEVSPNDPFIMCPSKDFDAYCVLDPTVKVKNKKVYPFPRPLEEINFQMPIPNNSIPVIGSFGFATKGKGFQHVVEAVNKEFDKAIIKINIPYGDFVPNSREYAAFIGSLCKQKAKKGIEVLITHDFMDKEELIKWCAANTLNCFLYDRDMPGLAATTDQAIVSERPLCISDNNTFRHITHYIPPYPKWSLNDCINKSASIVAEIKKDWSPENFSKKFSDLLIDNHKLIISKKKTGDRTFILPLKKNSIFNYLKNRIKKYKSKFKKIKIKTSFLNNDSKYSKEII